MSENESIGILSDKMTFVLRFLLSAFPQAIEPAAEIIDDAKRAHDPEIGSVHSERARELKQKLAKISERSLSAVEAKDDIDDALAMARHMLRGMVWAAVEDARQAASNTRWLWTVVDRFCTAI